MPTTTFRIVNEYTTFDSVKKCNVTVYECEELIDGRWEGFASLTYHN